MRLLNLYRLSFYREHNIIKNKYILIYTIYILLVDPMHFIAR